LTLWSTGNSLRESAFRNVVGVSDVPAGDPAEWITVSTDIDTSPDGGANGFHDMYLVFKNHPSQNARMFNLDYAEFSD
jgi:glucuronoarabinoxylan endo-1,4-beta-xylanase